MDYPWPGDSVWRSLSCASLRSGATPRCLQSGLKVNPDAVVTPSSQEVTVLPGRPAGGL